MNKTYGYYDDMKEPFFELIDKYDDFSLLPKRATDGSAGYDFVVAEDIIIPSYYKSAAKIDAAIEDIKPFDLNEVSALTKEKKFKPTLVPTGVKAYIPKSQFLQLSVRSSCPLKNWLILANGVGIIDSDYYNNPGNEGHIYFQFINLFPQDIILHKGDKIGQGIFLNYNRVNHDYNPDYIKTSREGGFGSTS